MKVHLVKHIGNIEDDYFTSTYCRMFSDEWSEKFADNVDTLLTQNPKNATCKKCLTAYNKTKRNK